MKYDKQRIFSVKVNFWIDERTLKKFDSLSRKRAESKSLIFREAIREYLKKHLKKQEFNMAGQKSPFYLLGEPFVVIPFKLMIDKDSKDMDLLVYLAISSYGLWCTNPSRC